MGRLEGKSCWSRRRARHRRGVAMLLSAERWRRCERPRYRPRWRRRGRLIAQQRLRIEAAGGMAWPTIRFITDYDAVGEMVQGAIDRYGKLDIVVNVPESSVTA